MCQNRNAFQARFLVQRHTNHDKKLVVHTGTDECKTAIGTALTHAALFGWSMWTQDISREYISRISKLIEDVYVKTKNRFMLKSNKLLS